MQRLFGTDGVRGRAGQFPLDTETVTTIGRALGREFRTLLGRDPRFISGRDTRESGPEIEAHLHAGAVTEGAICESAGVITTPGVAYLTRAFDFDAGIVVSASHNPYEDNGIKIFTPDGKKISSSVEQAIEAEVYAKNQNDVRLTEVDAHRTQEFCRSYLDSLRANAGDLLLDGLSLVVDCANGAASFLAPGLFESLGAKVLTINDRPDGKNINRESGSLHLEHITDRVIEARADLGIAFDGDADRALFVDERGGMVDGDATLWVLAKYLKQQGRLGSSRVVATVMSNIGLELALSSQGIELLRTDVGDKYVLRSLLETGSELGGEQSGHIIFPQISLVGDGMMTALLLLRAVREKSVSLSQAIEGFVRYPQILLNIPVREKRPFSEVPEIAAAASKVEGELRGQGRLLLRYSGTESLARVMIEGKDQKGIEGQARALANAIELSLG